MDRETIALFAALQGARVLAGAAVITVALLVATLTTFAIMHLAPPTHVEPTPGTDDPIGLPAAYGIIPALLVAYTIGYLTLTPPWQGGQDDA